MPTPEGGTHEAGFRAALTRGLKAYAELVGEKRAALLTAEDVVAQAGGPVSVCLLYTPDAADDLTGVVPGAPLYVGNKNDSLSTRSTTA